MSGKALGDVLFDVTPDTIRHLQQLPEDMEVQVPVRIEGEGGLIEAVHVHAGETDVPLPITTEMMVVDLDSTFEDAGIALPAYLWLQGSWDADEEAFSVLYMIGGVEPRFAAIHRAPE